MNAYDTKNNHVEFTGYGDSGMIHAWFSAAVNKDGFIRFVQFAQEQVNATKSGKATATSQVGGSFIAELERLGELRSKGLLTAEEFEMAKRKLLSP